MSDFGKRVGLDLGRYYVKGFDGKKFVGFKSIVGEARELSISNYNSTNGYHVRYQGEEYFVGDLAERESEYARNMYVNEKDTRDALILALTALHQYGVIRYDIITGLPLVNYTVADRQRFKDLLEGKHQVTVNGVTRMIDIARVRCSFEGGATYWLNPQSEGIVRIVDGGSKNVNCITIQDGMFLDKGSFGTDWGFADVTLKQVKHSVDKLVGSLGKKGWKKTDKVVVTGGFASLIAEHLKVYFPLATPLYEESKHVAEDGTTYDLNQFANAMGYYEVGGD